MPSKFQIMKSKDGKFHFHLLSPNGEVILSSQMYASKAIAKKGIASVQANPADLNQYEVRTNKAGEHYFVLKGHRQQRRLRWQDGHEKWHQVCLEECVECRY